MIQLPQEHELSDQGGLTVRAWDTVGVIFGVFIFCYFRVLIYLRSLKFRDRNGASQGWKEFLLNQHVPSEYNQQFGGVGHLGLYSAYIILDFPLTHHMKENHKCPKSLCPSG